MTGTLARRERPQLYSGPMVRSIIARLKTKTRRVMRLQPSTTPELHIDPKYGVVATWPGEGEFDGFDCHCPSGAPGDRLWVRESWGLHDTEPEDGPENATVLYRATDGERHDLRYQLWRPSIHMPRWASRITLEVTDVRVERLRDITESDAIAEGVRKLSKDDRVFKYAVFDKGDMSSVAWQDMPHSPIPAFTALWDSINADRGFSWDSNPWVWVTSFKLLTTKEKSCSTSTT